MPGIWYVLCRLGSRAMMRPSSSSHTPSHAQAMLLPPRTSFTAPQPQHPAWSYVLAFAHTAPSTGNTGAHPPLPRGYSVFLQVEGKEEPPVLGRRLDEASQAETQKRPQRRAPERESTIYPRAGSARSCRGQRHLVGSGHIAHYPRRSL